MASTPLRYGTPITLDAARRVMAAAEAEAARNQWPMVIAIVDTAGHLVMLHRMDQAQNGSIVMAMSRMGSAEQNSLSQSLYATTHSVASAGSISWRNTWLWKPRMLG